MKIAVTPAEEDEVIVAGAAVEAEPELAPEPVSEPEPEPEPEPEVAPAPKRAQPESHRETTLEDLESSKMSGMQRAIIIAAVVCIIGALVYYFVAMR